MPSNPQAPPSFTLTERWRIAIMLLVIPILAVLYLRNANSYMTDSGEILLPRITEVRLQRGTETAEKIIELPFSDSGIPQENLRFTIALMYKPNESGLFLIIPDDCVNELVVNSTKVDVIGDALEHRCDWKNGFRMDLTPYLHEGSNTISIAIYNIKGKTGLTFEPILK